MSVSNYLKLSFQDCKEHIRSLAVYSILVRTLIYFLTLFSDFMNTNYLNFLMFSEIYQNPDLFDIIVPPLCYFIKLFATEIFVTLPIYLLFFKEKNQRIKLFFKQRTKSFLVFKVIIFVFYSLLFFTGWHSYRISLIFVIGLCALVSVFFKNMIKVMIVTRNLTTVDAIKESFKILESQKAKRFLTFFAVELIFFIPYLLVIIFIIIIEPILYHIYIPQWLFLIAPLIDIFAEPLRIAFHLNFFYPKTKYEIKV